MIAVCIYDTIAVNKVDGYDLSNTVRCVCLTKKMAVDAILARKSGLNYLAVPIRWNSSVMKVSN